MMDDSTFDKRTAERKKRQAVWRMLRSFVADALARFNKSPDELVEQAEKRAGLPREPHA